jgi:hypothetical protein
VRTAKLQDVSIAKYLRTSNLLRKQGDGPTIQLNFLAKFEMPCKTCGIVHSYTMSDIEDFQSEESLPLGFERL